jgi:hypothetical protein
MYIRNAVAIILSATAVGTSALPAEMPSQQLCGAAPTGTVPQNAISQPSAATAKDCADQCDGKSTCQCFAFGLPPTAKVPICRLYSVSATQVPPGESNIVVFDKLCSNIPEKAPVNVINNTPAHQGGTVSHTRRGVCGVAPAGPSGNAPSPVATPSDVNNANSCLQLGKRTAGCKS